VLVGSPTHGSLTLLENGSLVYTPEIGFNGTVEFTYRLQDNFGAFSNTATVRIIVNGSNDQVVVSLIADPWDSTKTALRVIGTDGADTIQFVQQGNQDRIKVLVNNVSYGEFTFTGHILAYGLGGNDLIDVTDNIENVAVLLGGEGNDELSGGAGSAILLGGGGNDVIEGAKSRSILIGGDGSDRLVGGREDDILIGDVVQDQFDLSSLVHALGLWNLSVTYTQRITLLGGPSKILDLTILADDDSDLLTGGSGKDWYFAGRVDKVSGQASDEVLTAV
jgi:Ca2+-binding RTX toxin-like protein